MCPAGLSLGLDLKFGAQLGHYHFTFITAHNRTKGLRRWRQQLVSHLRNALQSFALWPWALESWALSQVLRPHSPGEGRASAYWRSGLAQQPSLPLTKLLGAHFRLQLKQGTKSDVSGT